MFRQVSYVMAVRSTAAVTDDRDRLCELQRQVRSCQRQLSQLHQRAGHDLKRRTGDQDASSRGADGGARHHQCRLRTLHEKLETQQQLLLQLQRQTLPLNASLLDNMNQQQTRIAEVRSSVQYDTVTS